MKIIIFGATGMVGEGVLLTTLEHPDTESVLVISRRPCEVTHAKIKEIIHKDFFDYSPVKTHLYGYDACLFCLGVSSIGMKEMDYTRVTYDLTLSAARALSALNPAMTFCYVSGAGTDSTGKSRQMWARVKGKTENDLRDLAFKASYAFRPGFIKPLRGQKRAFKAAKVIGVLYPVLKFFFPKYVCTMADLGLAMISVSSRGHSKPILENKDITAVALAEREKGQR